MGARVEPTVNDRERAERILGRMRSLGVVADLANAEACLREIAEEIAAHRAATDEAWRQGLLTTAAAARVGRAFDRARNP